MSNIGIALQLYTLRGPAADDLAGTLERARDCGFDFVQWSGMPDLPASEIRAYLDQAGLKAIAGHAPAEDFEKDFDAAVAHWQTIGAPDIAPGSMMADCQDSLDAWRRGAARLNALGARLREADMRLSYHNHAFELKTFPEDERCKLDLLYEETDPENLYAELDTAWLHLGGVDPAEYIRKYVGRCPLIHLKDVAKEPDSDGKPVFVPLGEGVLDWESIFDAGEEAAVEWYIYEQDTCQGDPFESLQISYDFLAQYA